jgi:hypothetical protein
VDSGYFLGFEPDAGREMFGNSLVQKLYFLDLGWIETAIQGAAQAVFAEKVVNELDTWVGL